MAPKRYKITLFLWILTALFDMIFLKNTLADGPEYRGKGKRDPFVPLVTLTSRVPSKLVGLQKPDEAKLEGIVYDPQGSSVALVNGSLLKEGDLAGSFQVQKIQPDGIWVQINGEDSFKPLYTEESEKEPKENAKKSKQA